MDTEKRLTAAICTHNRADYLDKALASLANQTLSPEQFEILVVDNNSSDHTKSVVERYRHLAHLRYLFEPVPGLSRARNLALREATGRYIAYLDDDAVAEPTWAENYVKAFTSTAPLPGSVGGKCLPIWEAPRPDWLHDKLLSSLSVYDWSPTPIVLNDDQWVSGCNIAYPVALLRELGGFREDLGRTGTKLLAGEETFVRQQLDRLGHRTLYDPQIVVGHHVSPRRLNKDWFRGHAIGTGQSDAVMTYGARTLSLAQKLVATVKRLLWSLPRMAVGLLARQPATRFYRQYQTYESLGFIRGIWSLPERGAR